MATKDTRYIEAVGRRKTSVARVRISFDKSGFSINDLPLAEYFPVKELQHMVESPIKKLDVAKIYVSAKVSGGGISSQAESVRLGISRALLLNDPTVRITLKKEGMLRRDSRSKERRKFGLKKARKAPQWSKR
ncbi:MAG: 30S ribosomal protein S9 [Candidatus Paceibacterota bacterium]